MAMSNDEGREREGSKYYYDQRVKELCGGCGRIMRADAERCEAIWCLTS